MAKSYKGDSSCLLLCFEKFWGQSTLVFTKKLCFKMQVWCQHSCPFSLDHVAGTCQLLSCLRSRWKWNNEVIKCGSKRGIAQNNYPEAGARVPLCDACKLGFQEKSCLVDRIPWFEQKTLPVLCIEIHRFLIAANIDQTGNTKPNVRPQHQITFIDYSNL